MGVVTGTGLAAFWNKANRYAWSVNGNPAVDAMRDCSSSPDRAFFASGFQSAGFSSGLCHI